MSIDLNDAQPQMEGGVIPDGTFCKLNMAIRPGGHSMPGLEAADNGLFKASTSSDVLMIDCEFTVMAGPFAKRKLWQNFTVAGGQIDDKGASKGFNVTKSQLRAMIESAVGLSPDDMSDKAKAQRVFQAFKQLDGLQFFAKIGIEPGAVKPNTNPQQFYPDKNKIAHIVTVKDKEYAALAAGQEVAAGGPPAVAASAPASAPAWGGKTQVPASPATQPNSPTSGPAWLRS